MICFSKDTICISSSEVSIQADYSLSPGEAVTFDKQTQLVLSLTTIDGVLARKELDVDASGKL